MDKEQILKEYSKQHIQGKVIYQSYCNLGVNSSFVVLTYYGIYDLYQFILNGDNITYTCTILLPEELQGIFEMVNKLQ